jgi:TnpA family transposase
VLQLCRPARWALRGEIELLNCLLQDLLLWLRQNKAPEFTGLNAITVPGTLRDSLVLLAVVLEQQTELQPIQIMTDTGAYSDVVFGLFRLLGYRFSPRLADIGGTRFWRIDPQADYGELNAIARQRINLQLIASHWDDLLRLAGSLKLGRVSYLDLH